MKLSQGVEWSLHCLLLLTQTDDAASRHTVAGYFDLPVAYLAKHLKSLVRAGILTAVSGPRGGFRLARAPEQITVLDVVEAIEGSVPPFVCTEIRQRGACAVPPERCTGPCPVAKVMYEADRAWRDALRSVTLAQIADQLPPISHARAQAWLENPSASLPAWG
jgi:Rrf2 family protein